MKTRISALMGAAAALTLATGLALAAPGEPGHTHKSLAAGEPGDPKKPVARTIEVTMKETDDAKMLFEPNKVEIKRGEQVKFAAKQNRQQVIANVYVAGRWDRVEHFHEECYGEAHDPYGEPRV